MIKPICKVVIKDQVNIKLDGLDPSVRRKCVDALKFKLPNARYLQSVRLGRWDGAVSFCTAGGGTYLNLLPVLYPIIEKAGYEFKLEDQRPDFNFDVPEIDNNYLINSVWGKGHQLEGQSIVLEDHQVSAVNELLRCRQGVAECGTGSGKTLVTAVLSKLTQEFGRSIIVVPSKDLVIQTEEDYKLLGLDVGVFFGGRKELNKTHTICTWQSLDRLNSNSKNGLSDIEISEFLDNVIMVLVDECFDPYTTILMANGTKKFIKDIKIGDAITNYDEKNICFKTDIVMNVHKNLTNSQSEDMLELKFDNEAVIKVTANHKFLTSNRGWVRADELNEHDDIMYNAASRRTRTYTQIKDDVNTILISNSQQIRVIEYSKSSMLLNTGAYLTTAEIMHFKRRIMGAATKDKIDLIYIDGVDPALIYKEARSAEGKRFAARTHKKWEDEGKENPIIAYKRENPTPHNKGKKYLGTGWSNGLTKETHTGLMTTSTKQMGSGNSVHKQTAATKKQSAAKQSATMKKKILSGEFTPNVTNSMTHWTATYKNERFRSSWEAAFKSLNPDFLYEKIRIPYFDEERNKERILITDFSNDDEKIIIEIKPREHINKPSEARKIDTTQAWCLDNGYQFILLSQEYFVANFDKIDFANIDKNSQVSLRKMYETYIKKNNKKT